MYKKARKVVVANLNLSGFFAFVVTVAIVVAYGNLSLIVVIQKFGYHGNLMSHFSSLFENCKIDAVQKILN